MNWNGDIDLVVGLVSPYPLPDAEVDDDQHVHGTESPPT
jgi:hypothetical protein